MPSIADFDLSIEKGYSEVSNFVCTNQSTSDLEDAAVWEYLWDFGDGETSTEENPIHTYSAPGTYTILLTTNDGTDIEGDPDLDPPPPPLTNTYEIDVVVYSRPTIGGSDPTDRPASTMKQYGNVDEGLTYEYTMPLNWDRTEIAGETCYIHATQVPEDFMVFQNTDPDDDEHYTPSLLSTDFKAQLFGCPVEEWDIGTHTIIVTLTATLNNGEAVTDVKEFDLTFGNHPHIPLWDDDPETTALVGSQYSQTIKAIDPDLIGANGTEELTIVAQTSGEIGETGISAVALPEWLTVTVGDTQQEEIDGKMKSTCSVTLSGVPTEDDIGTTLICLVVTDSYGLNMIKVFGLVVE